MAQDVEGVKSVSDSEEAIKDLSQLRLSARKECMALKSLSGHTEVKGTPRSSEYTLPWSSGTNFYGALATAALQNLGVCDEINYWNTL